MLDDTVWVRCTRCKGVFRDKARRIQSGYSRQCSNCEVMMFFEEYSPDKNIQMALRDAREVRKALQVHEEEAVVLRRKPPIGRRGGDSPDVDPDPSSSEVKSHRS